MVCVCRLQTPVDVQYRAVFCLWMLTYEPSCVAKLAKTAIAGLHYPEP